MKNIITISREFGSGGRELAKRLAEYLGYHYYDKNILDIVAEKWDIDPEYYEHVVEKSTFPYPIGKSFAAYSSYHKIKTDSLLKQRNVLMEIAKKGNCVIVGRGADLVLKTFNPVRIFVYANMENKLARCKGRQAEGESLSDSELLRLIKQTDKDRARLYLFLGGDKWGRKENYDICINTSKGEIKDMVAPLGEMIKKL